MAESCVPGTSKSVTISNEVKNFHRLYEIIRSAQTHLRCLFQDLYLSRFNTPWCRENGEILFKSLPSEHFLKDVNRKIRAGDLNEWDFTTLSFVILKLSEKEDEREAVIQLREIRNALSHLGGDWGVKDEDYEKHVRDLENYLAALGLQDYQITGIMENAKSLHFGEDKFPSKEQRKAYLDAIGLSEPDEDEILSIRSAAGNIRFNKSKFVYKDKTAKTGGGHECFGLWLDYIDNFISSVDKKRSPESESSSNSDTETEEEKAESEWTSFQQLPRNGKDMLKNMRKMMQETKKDPKNAPKKALLNFAGGFLSAVGKNFERKAKRRKEKTQQHNSNSAENVESGNISKCNDPCADELD